MSNIHSALRNWKHLQDEGKSTDQTFYSIVDLHAITQPFDPDQLRRDTREMAASLLAVGIDPEAAPIFQQSAVRHHSELCWLLSCRTPLGWLNRMTQFKSKSGGGSVRSAEKHCLGLYAYPVLMAADIMLYDTTHVPVGDDQKQHLELARDISIAFNNDFSECLTVPDGIFVENGARVMSLRDGTKKMSKSDISEMTRVNLSDSADAIRKKIRKAKTDSGDDWASALASPSGEIERPEVHNLMSIWAALESHSMEHLAEELDRRALSLADFKRELADVIVAHVEPIGREIERISEDREMLDGVLHRGNQKAMETAERTMQRVRRAMGMAVH